MTDKPRRSRKTVAEKTAEHDERIARLRTELEDAIAARAAYIASVREKAAALTAELPKE